MSRRPLCTLVFGGILAAAFAAAPSDRDAVAARQTVAPPTAPFDELSFVLEANANDIDGEVILHAETGQPLEKFALVAPNGRIVQMLDASGSSIGISEFRLESGEPGVESVCRAFPAGVYTVRALALSGELFVGTVELSHELPARFAIQSPQQAVLVPREDVMVSWTSDPEVARYTLEIEDDDDEARLNITLQPGQSSFHVPPSLLRADTEYQLVLVAHHASGNRIVEEVEFRTQR